jgi:hypothetical protein
MSPKLTPNKPGAFGTAIVELFLDYCEWDAVEKFTSFDWMDHFTPPPMPRIEQSVPHSMTQCSLFEERNHINRDILDLLVTKPSRIVINLIGDRVSPM